MYITNNIFISRKIRKNRTITYYIAMHRVCAYNRKKNNENICQQDTKATTKGNSDSKES